jgi:4'-phosphopantetheinyl transferase
MHTRAPITLAIGVTPAALDRDAAFSTHIHKRPNGGDGGRSGKPSPMGAARLAYIRLAMVDVQAKPTPAPCTPMPAWEHSHSHPPLAEGAIHLWRVDLASVRHDLRRALSLEERERSERFLREQDRRLWIGAHGVLRVLLGRYLERDPGSLRFTGGTHGKPKLVENPSESSAAAGRTSAEPARIRFNLSHSDRLALLAFTRSGEIGVDVEVSRRPINQLALAARAFGADEARHLAALSPALRKREFLQSWVRHEAELKCRGTGIGGAAADVRGSEPWIAELAVGPRAAAAVAVEGTARELRCWSWQD